MRAWKFLTAALAVASAVSAQSTVAFTLATKDARTQFALGEAIDLELHFSTLVPSQYEVWTTNTGRTVRQPRFDRFTVTPMNGTADPLHDIFAQKDGGVLAGIPPRPAAFHSGSVVVPLTLNEWVSIRLPGHYRVTAESTRVVDATPAHKALPLQSNTLEIDVVAPKPGWAAAELRQASSDLERGGTDAAQAARIIRFLETREAVSALTRYFENGPSAAQEQLHAGIFGSPYREDVIAAMEASVAAPDFPVTYYYLGTLMELRQIRRIGPTPLFTAETTEEFQRWVNEVEGPRRNAAQAVESEQFAKLAEAIGRKRGQALAVSLSTLIDRGPQPPSGASISTLVSHFSDLPQSAQYNLLTYGWSKVASPSLLPLLESLCSGSSPLRDAALQHLIELDPVAARKAVTDRIRRGDILRNTAENNPRALLTLPDKTLPELDDAMLTALEQGKPVDVPIARYASDAALPRVRAVIERSPGINCAGALLAYLFRVQESYAADLVSDARSLQPGGCLLNLSPNEDLLMSPGLERQAINDLTNPDPMTRRTAQTLLQYGGSAAAEQPLWDALARLAGREPQPMDSDEFGISEALSKAEGWTLTPREIDRLIAACRTDSCRNQATAMHRWLAEPVAISGTNIPNIYVTVGLFMLRSREQLERKVSQFPKGSAFSIEIRENTWFANHRRDEIRSILKTTGMKIIER